VTDAINFVADSTQEMMVGLIEEVRSLSTAAVDIVDEAADIVDRVTDADDEVAGQNDPLRSVDEELQDLSATMEEVATSSDQVPSVADRAEKGVEAGRAAREEGDRRRDGRGAGRNRRDARGVDGGHRRAGRPTHPTRYPKCFLRSNTGSGMDGGGSTDMTLAFELEALKRLARPEEVFSDARTWSEYVGVVSEKPTYVVTNFTRKNRIRQDFFSGPRGREESLENVRAQFDTERHVFVGVDDGDADLADGVGWEYLPVGRAAEAADWTLGEADTDADDATDDDRDDWP